MAKKSETLKQREKAQKDLLELKRMQAGLLDPGPKPSEEAVAPATFKEKKDNFFYHYKFVVLMVAFIAVIGVILIYDLVTKVHYDAKVVVYSYDTVYSLYNEKIAEYFEQFYSDVNGNGAVEIAAVDCSIDPNSVSEVQDAKMMQLQAILASETDTLIYLLDEESMVYFENALEDMTLFKKEDMVELGEDFYKFIETEGFILPETKLYAAIRAVDGTLFEGKAEESVTAAQEVMQRLREAG